MMRDKTMDTSIHLLVPRALADRARETADRLGISVSDLIRILIDRGTHDVGI
jgi:antitoxin component of RelBE/YafQ-DinJ toxin-antitoxin module